MEMNIIQREYFKEAFLDVVDNKELDSKYIGFESMLFDLIEKGEIVFAEVQIDDISKHFRKFSFLKESALQNHLKEFEFVKSEFLNDGLFIQYIKHRIGSMKMDNANYEELIMENNDEIAEIEKFLPLGILYDFSFKLSNGLIQKFGEEYNQTYYVSKTNEGNLKVYYTDIESGEKTFSTYTTEEMEDSIKNGHWIVCQ